MILYISDTNRKFGSNERVYFNMSKEKDVYKAVATNTPFEILATDLKELKSWLCENIPNYRSNEHELDTKNHHSNLSSGFLLFFYNIVSAMIFIPNFLNSFTTRIKS